MDRRCSRVILRNKLERTAEEARSWWGRVFSSTEANATIPPERRRTVLKETLPENVFRKVLDILGFDDNYEEENDAIVAKESKASSKAGSSIHSVATIDNWRGIDAEKKQLDKHKARRKEEIKADLSRDSRKSSESVIGGLKQKRKEIGSKNPYLRFQKRRLDRAAIWHPKPPLLVEGMDLIQKADAITEQIAYDFVEWLNSITDPEEETPSNVTVSTIKTLFNIGYNTNAATSLSIKLKEMASVPEAVAKMVKRPNMSKRSQLHSQIRRDIKAAGKKTEEFAFGAKLPSDWISVPPKIEEIRKWQVCKVPEDLQSMATVWKGITHLTSTRAFCQYLAENPQIPRPKYLIDCHMLEPAFLQESRISFESAREIANILPPDFQESAEQLLDSPPGGVP